MKAYRFKITLKHSKPPIWRRVDVPANMSFKQFSDVIQLLFGFEGRHLAEFSFPNSEICLQENPIEDMDWFKQMLVMARHSLEEFEMYPRFNYTYDFGDNWEFQIVREAIVEEHSVPYAVLKKHKGDNLIEDVGGVWGYYEVLAAWKDPENADPELLEWSGDQDMYDFDPAEMNEFLMTFPVPENGSFTIPEDAPEEDSCEENEEVSDVSEKEMLVSKINDLVLPKNSEELAQMFGMIQMDTIMQVLLDIVQNLELKPEDVVNALQLDDVIRQRILITLKNSLEQS